MSFIPWSQYVADYWCGYHGDCVVISIQGSFPTTRVELSGTNQYDRGGFVTLALLVIARSMKCVCLIWHSWVEVMALATTITITNEWIQHQYFSLSRIKLLAKDWTTDHLVMFVAVGSSNRAPPFLYQNGLYLMISFKPWLFTRECSL